MTDYTDPESPVADPHAAERLQFKLGADAWDIAFQSLVCIHCRLPIDRHINAQFCPEWRLRQLDGDR